MVVRRALPLHNLKPSCGRSTGFLSKWFRGKIGMVVWGFVTAAPPLNGGGWLLRFGFMFFLLVFVVYGVDSFFVEMISFVLWRLLVFSFLWCFSLRTPFTKLFLYSRINWCVGSHQQWGVSWFCVISLRGKRRRKEEDKGRERRDIFFF